MTERTWLVTGAGRGLGRSIVGRVLDQGDRVVATARRPEMLADQLAPFGDRALVLALDVRDRDGARATVDAAIDFGRGLDVLVNNAGYGLSGAVEEVTESQAREQFDTNFFGALWMTQAVLPHMRERRCGHIIQISSIAGLTSFPNTGLYAASKWALEAMSEALAGEIGPLGIRVTIIEPSGMRTDWAGSSMERAGRIAAYDEVLAARRTASAGGPSRPVPAGDPEVAAQRILDVVAHDAPPLRVLLGNGAFDLATAAHERRLREFADWESVSRSIDVASA